MTNIQIITDASACLPADLIAEKNILLNPLYINFSDMSIDASKIDSREFYKKLAAEKKVPTTSQPVIKDLLETFGKPLREGKDILAFLIPAAMSGTYDTALLAKKHFASVYPERRIEIIDPGCMCMQLGFLVEEAAKNAGKGKSPKEIITAFENSRRKSKTLFTIKSLDNLKKGSRTGHAAYLAGSLLQISPILTFDAAGSINAIDKVRTMEKAEKKIFRIFEKDVADYGLSKAVLHYSADRTEVAAPEKMTAEFLPGKNPEAVPVSNIIGVHSGRGVAGISYMTEKPFR